ncbi:MAG: hypothetical protein VB858_18610 [Planctomycetaceae bacterium]
MSEKCFQYTNKAIHPESRRDARHHRRNGTPAGGFSGFVEKRQGEILEGVAAALPLHLRAAAELRIRPAAAIPLIAFLATIDRVVINA